MAGLSLMIVIYSSTLVCCCWSGQGLVGSGGCCYLAWKLDISRGSGGVSGKLMRI